MPKRVSFAQAIAGANAPAVPLGMSEVSHARFTAPTTPVDNSVLVAGSPERTLFHLAEDDETSHLVEIISRDANGAIETDANGNAVTRTVKHTFFKPKSETLRMTRVIPFGKPPKPVIYRDRYGVRLPSGYGSAGDNWLTLNKRITPTTPERMAELRAKMRETMQRSEPSIADVQPRRAKGL
jgi:hypothetical protein